MWSHVWVSLSLSTTPCPSCTAAHNFLKHSGHFFEVVFGGATRGQVRTSDALLLTKLPPWRPNNLHVGLPIHALTHGRHLAPFQRDRSFSGASGTAGGCTVLAKTRLPLLLGGSYHPLPGSLNGLLLLTFLTLLSRLASINNISMLTSMFTSMLWSGTPVVVRCSLVKVPQIKRWACCAQLLVHHTRYYAVKNAEHVLFCVLVFWARWPCYTTTFSNLLIVAWTSCVLLYCNILVSNALQATYALTCVLLLYLLCTGSGMTWRPPSTTVQWKRTRRI